MKKMFMQKPSWLGLPTPRPANWLHVAWACVAWLDGRPRPKKAPARKRLGWPAPRDTKERARSVLRWLARLRATLLQREYVT